MESVVESGFSCYNIFILSKGAKVRFYLDVEKNLYIASCGRKDFGIVKFLKDGNKKDLEMLGTEFGGVVLHTDLDQYLMEVLVKAQEKAA